MDNEHNHSGGALPVWDIIRIVFSAVLLIAAAILCKTVGFSVPVTVILFAVPYLTAGYKVLFEAAENIVKGEIFDENFLMCIASIGAFAVGEYAEAVFVMIFFCIGELLEEIATEKSRRTVKSLLDIRPDTATLIKDGNEISVLSKDVLQGDIIRVVAGERIPLDGIIVSGATSTDNSSITGESVPVNAAAGDTVFSGCINLSGVVEIKVTKTFTESTASKILELVENSSEKKSKSEKFIRKFARIYTPFVCIAALLLAVIPSLIFGNTRQYIYRALTFLVVSCPCALVVSVPLTYFAGIASAAKDGILIKGAQYIQTVTRLKTVVFDKTGTLTKGSFHIASVECADKEKNEIIRIAAIAERNSTHPIALSVKSEYSFKDGDEAEDIKEIPGEGIICVIDGKKTAVGNKKLLENSGINVPYEESELTSVFVAQSGKLSGIITLDDTLKPNAKTTVAFLKKSGIKTVMLSGDKNSVAKRVAKELCIDECYFELKPEDKVGTLEKIINDKNATAFVGDGINDAAAICRADVGIAMGALGSDAAIEAADIVFMNDNIDALQKTVKVAKKTQRIVAENIIFSLAVKFLILILCGVGIGITDMWMASFGDVGVLLIAIINSLRALK